MTSIVPLRQYLLHACGETGRSLQHAKIVGSCLHACGETGQSATACENS